MLLLFPLQDPVGSSTQWHLNKIEVTPATTKATSSFSYRSYLNGMNSSASLTQTSMHDLEVTVNTSSKGQPDPFDGDVFLTLGGSYSAMDEVQLSGGDLEFNGGVFASGSALSFSIKAPEMGSLTTATIRVVSAHLLLPICYLLVCGGYPPSMGRRTKVVLLALNGTPQSTRSCVCVCAIGLLSFQE